MLERDLSLFPVDKTGDALWQLLNQGVDLNSAYEVEFSMLFKDKQQALTFGQLLLENNQKVSFCAYPENELYAWEVTAYPEMPLIHQNMMGYKELLESNAQPSDYVYAGWYCFAFGDVIAAEEAL